LTFPQIGRFASGPLQTADHRSGGARAAVAGNPTDLRIATSCARHAVSGQAAAQARSELAQTLARFTEGSGTADLRVARDLLSAPSQAAPR
jgi:hypothetical protein